MRAPLFCLALGAWLLLSASAGLAQAVVVSPGPDSVDVTVYRNPGRSADTPLELGWLGGYALISETRRISIPAGETEIRFEGVAGGILPQSAIVTGFPDGIVERNRDAYLLSPGTLLDRSLGRSVHLRRTNLATGEVREQEVVIRSSASGAVVLQTGEGFETLRCTGLPETLVYDSVPSGLSSKPTLSVRTRSSAPVTAMVTLSYLATGFDWQANYIGTLSADGRRLDLFAWLTLANGDETSFVNADTQAVAGRLNREEVAPERPVALPLQLDCWPQATTSSLPLAGAPPPPPAPPMLDEMRARVGAVRNESIVVTGSRIMARQEELGDLKLYRIPEPVTVAANSQKQVALLRRENVEVRMVYRRLLAAGSTYDSSPAERYLVTRNRAAEGLGLPLPSGGVSLFTPREGRPILIGEGAVEDSAIGDDVEIRVGEAPGVLVQVEELDDEDEEKQGTDYRVTVSNDQAVPVQFEGEFNLDDDVEFQPGRRLPRRDGRPLWSVRVPANGTAVLQYSVIHREED